MSQKMLKPNATRSYLKSEMMALGCEVGRYGASASDVNDHERSEDELRRVKERMLEIIMSYDGSDDVVDQDDYSMEV